MRDCFSVAPRVPARLLATRYRAPGEPDDSRIAIQRVHDEPGILSAFDRDFGPHDSYVLHRPIRWLVLRPDNRNPRHNHRTDAGGETYSPKNFGSASIAKEYVQARSPSFAAVEHDPQRVILLSTRVPKSVSGCPLPQSSPHKRGEAETGHPLLTLNAVR